MGGTSRGSPVGTSSPTGTGMAHARCGAARACQRVLPATVVVVQQREAMVTTTTTTTTEQGLVQVRARAFAGTQLDWCGIRIFGGTLWSGWGHDRGPGAGHRHGHELPPGSGHIVGGHDCSRRFGHVDALPCRKLRHGRGARVGRGGTAGGGSGRATGPAHERNVVAMGILWIAGHARCANLIAGVTASWNSILEQRYGFCPTGV